MPAVGGGGGAADLPGEVGEVLVGRDGGGGQGARHADDPRGGGSSPAACRGSRAGCCPSGSTTSNAPGWCGTRTAGTARRRRGEDLRGVVLGLAEWGARWAFGRPRADELDATVLVWWIRGGLEPEAFGDRERVVLHVRFRQGARRRYWLVVSRGDVSLCFTDPGVDVDVTVEGDLDALYEVWEGRVEYGCAVRGRRLVVTGETALVRALPRSFRFSPIAPYVREATARTVPAPR